MDIGAIIEKAKSEPFYLKLLNFGLSKMIPFNKPHGFKIINISDDYIKTSLPFKKKNLNHVKGLHACALATLCEFTTGVMLISKLGFKEYRIILKNIEVEYLYQGKMNATAEYKLSHDWLQNNVFDPLQMNESVLVDCPIDIFDIENNHLATAKVVWQLKEWEKVKTKVS